MSANGSKTLAGALLAAQAKMPAVEKNADNPFFKSKYTTYDHLLAKALPVLRSEGILVTQWPTIVDGTPALRTRLTHVESGEFEEDVMPLATLKDGPQEQGSCLTYAKRYALSAALCISTEDDDDANSASKPAPAAVTVPTGETSSAPSSAPSGGSTSSAPQLLPHQKKAYAVYKKTEEAGLTTKDETLNYLTGELGAMKWSELGPDGAKKLITWLEAKTAPGYTGEDEPFS